MLRALRRGKSIERTRRRIAFRIGFRLDVDWVEPGSHEEERLGRAAELLRALGHLPEAQEGASGAEAAHVRMGLGTLELQGRMEDSDLESKRRS